MDVIAQLTTIRLPLVDSLIPHLARVFPPYLVAHTHLLITTIVVYHGIYVLSTVLSPVLFPTTFAKLPAKTRIDFNIHLVSMIQSVSILLLCVPFFVEELVGWETPMARVYAVNDYFTVLATLALGYFLWDATLSLIYVKLFGIGFLVHGVMSAMVFFIGMTPFIQYYAPVFIMFEISTPFLNLRWYGLKVPGLFSSTFQLINNGILILIFFGVRICYGLTMAWKLFNDFAICFQDGQLSGVSLLKAVIIATGNIVLNCLNAWWFWRMSVVAYTVISGMITKKGVDLNEKNEKDD